MIYVVERIGDAQNEAKSLGYEYDNSCDVGRLFKDFMAEKDDIVPSFMIRQKPAECLSDHVGKYRLMDTLVENLT